MFYRALPLKTLCEKSMKIQRLDVNVNLSQSERLYEMSRPSLYATNLVAQFSRMMHISSLYRKAEDRRGMLASMPAKDEGTEGEKTVDIDTFIKRDGESLFPDETTPKKLFNGVPYEELPILNIKVSPNNTILSITDHKGGVKMIHSCGIEGFKNTRKGTNVAAQATAISLSMKALEKGYKTVRVKVRGLGPGRMASIKGLQMGGMDIVSITDSTPVSWYPPRPRKQKKL